MIITNDSQQLQFHFYNFVTNFVYDIYGIKKAHPVANHIIFHVYQPRFLTVPRRPVGKCATRRPTDVPIQNSKQPPYVVTWSRPGAAPTARSAFPSLPPPFRSPHFFPSRFLFPLLSSTSSSQAEATASLRPGRRLGALAVLALEASTVAAVGAVARCFLRR
jgi:hypothetical protein